VADIKIDDETIYHRHTVAIDESLSKIAKHYCDKPMKYTAIFEANKDVLSNPDVVDPGQELIIPNL
jgi:nucleoid-associated protein YgaU